MRRFFLIFFPLVILIVIFPGLPAETYSGNERNKAEYPPGYSTPWVDSVFASLDLEQRIAQLLMIRVHTDRDKEYYNEMVRLVRRYNLGGVAFFRGNPLEQLLLTNRMQSQAQTPLLVAIDAEWGLSMRLDSTIAFPRKMALGAIADERLIYNMGHEIGQQLKRLGVHISFAPVLDVNNNPDNPVINFRSFGERPQNVARKGLAYMQGLQDAGIIACGKHFPGHGDTDADSHHTLPLLNHTVEEIKAIHLYPFLQLINNGLHSVMIAHLEIPALEGEEGLAATLSHRIVTDLLKNEMGFEGLVITDALDMRGVSDYFEPGELELRALMAGNDILLLPADVPKAINTIKTSIRQGLIDEELVNRTCKKILYFKEMAGLHTFNYLMPDRLFEDLNNNMANMLKKQLTEASLTLVRNENNLIPVTDLSNKRIAALSVGEYPGNTFHQMLANYAPVSLYGIDKYHTPQRAYQMVQQLKEYDLVIVSVHNNSYFVRDDYGINGKTVGLIYSIARDNDVVLSLFANPYSIAFFDDEILSIESILVAHEEGQVFEEAAAQAIFGAFPLQGSLSVSAGNHFPAGKGLLSSPASRIRFGMPEETGIPAELLKDIDSMAIRGIKNRAYPGCQIAIIKDGVMIYNRSFGYHTYDILSPVLTTDIYDLASITKTAATTAAAMRLVDKGLLDIDKPLSHYLPWLTGTNKEHINLREMMAHQGRLASWIPFYRETMIEDQYAEGIYHWQRTGDYPVQVAHNLYISKGYQDTIYAQLAASELLEENSYTYSDLGFILMGDIIAQVTGMGIDRYIDREFIRPLGLSTMGYLPANRFSTRRIVPTENDTRWRKQVIHGHVHDPAAAMLGGVAGHAGLFSNATDLAIMMQLLLNEGSYGGEQYFNQETVNEFTSVQFLENNNRRALGFDKPGTGADRNRIPAPCASPASFGHTGFTGTMAWADPEENLVFVFLSNRTYPDQHNTTISRDSIRTNIHQAIYDAISRSEITGTTIRSGTGKLPLND